MISDHLEISVNNYDATNTVFNKFDTASACPISISYLLNAPPSSSNVSLYYLNPTTNLYELVNPATL